MQEGSWDCGSGNCLVCFTGICRAESFGQRRTRLSGTGSISSNDLTGRNSVFQTIDGVIGPFAGQAGAGRTTSGCAHPKQASAAAAANDNGLPESAKFGRFHWPGQRSFSSAIAAGPGAGRVVADKSRHGGADCE